MNLMSFLKAVSSLRGSYRLRKADPSRVYSGSVSIALLETVTSHLASFFVSSLGLRHRSPCAQNKVRSCVCLCNPFLVLMGPTYAYSVLKIFPTMNWLSYLLSQTKFSHNRVHRSYPTYIGVTYLVFSAE